MAVVVIEGAFGQNTPLNAGLVWAKTCCLSPLFPQERASCVKTLVCQNVVRG